jgi:hypothetical protein
VLHQKEKEAPQKSIYKSCSLNAVLNYTIKRSEAEKKMTVLKVTKNFRVWSGSFERAQNSTRDILITVNDDKQCKGYTEDI